MNRLPGLVKERRSDSIQGYGNTEGYQNYHSQRSMSFHHNQMQGQNESAQAYREFRIERDERSKAEKDALLIKNRIILLQRQQIKEQKKLECSRNKAVKLFNMKKQIQTDKDQITQRRLEEEEVKEQNGIVLRENKAKNSVKQKDLKLINQQQKKLECFRLKQQAAVDKQRRLQLDQQILMQNQRKRNERLNYEKALTAHKQQQAAKKAEDLQYKLQSEKQKNSEIKGYINQLEQMEQNLLYNVQKTKSEQQNYVDKIKYATNQNFQVVKETFPDINRKQNQQYEENQVLDAYVSPYNQNAIKKDKKNQTGGISDTYKDYMHKDSKY